MRVIARYLASQPKAKRKKRGGALRWYAGIISAVDEENGTYEVLYDDGVCEGSVLAQFIVAEEEKEDEEGVGNDDNEQEADEDDNEGGAEVKLEETDVDSQLPKNGTLRYDIFVAICDTAQRVSSQETRQPRPQGEQAWSAVERDDIFKHICEHGMADTRGRHDLKILRGDVVTCLGRESRQSVQPALWEQEGTSYRLTAEGRRAASLRSVHDGAPEAAGRAHKRVKAEHD